LPRPSKERGLSPRKSRILGIATDISRSRNSYIRAPLRVTVAPTGMPARSLKAAIDLRARRTFGRCPAMVASWSMAASRTFESCLASPIPMFSVIFSMRGTSMALR
jgi:hypothetical protein